MSSEKRLVARYAVSFDRMAMDDAGKLEHLLRDHVAAGQEVTGHPDLVRDVQVYEVYERVVGVSLAGISWDEARTGSDMTLTKVMKEVAALKRANVVLRPDQVQSAIVHPSLLAELRASLRARGIEPKDWPEEPEDD